jgi:hypothetical protein
MIMNLETDIQPPAAPPVGSGAVLGIHELTTESKYWISLLRSESDKANWTRELQKRNCFEQHAIVAPRIPLKLVLMEMRRAVSPKWWEYPLIGLCRMMDIITDAMEWCLNKITP